MCGMRQTLAAYRTLPHSTTGCSPASLMLSFPVKTPLNKLAVSVTAAVNGQVRTELRPSRSSVALPSATNIERRVRFAQQLMKDRHDQRVHAKPTQIVAGDSVRIRLPSTGHKLAPVYTDPVLVTKSQGNTVWTADGKRWNVRRCIRVQSSMRQQQSVDGSASVVPSDTSTQRNANHSDYTEPSDNTIAFNSSLDTTGFAPVAPPDLRRSSRARRSTDFGPFVLFNRLRFD